MFDEFKALLNAMTPKERESKLKALTDVTRLKTLCQAKGWADLEPEKMRIVITDRQPQVDELLKALLAAGVGGIKMYSYDGVNGESGHAEG